MHAILACSNLRALLCCMQIVWEKMHWMEDTFGLKPWYMQDKSPGT